MLRNLIPGIFVALLLCNALAQKPSPDLAITDVNVIPMDTERVLEHQTVLIRNGKIIAIRSSLTLPPGARRIDGTGKFLTPGLIDGHVHLMSPDDLISYLAYGVTTVVNMSGTPADLKMRHEVRRGARLGPNIYTAGPTIDGYPPLNEVFVTAETPEQGVALVIDHKRAGYDFIKVYGTLRPDVFHAIAAACRREHIALTGHINRQMPTEDVFREGQVLAAHAEDLIFARFDHPPSRDELAALASEVKRAGITVTANIAINPTTETQVQNLVQVLAQDEAQYLSAATYSRWIRPNNRNLDEDPKQHLENLQSAQALNLQFIRLLHDLNVPIILGTDASAYGFPGQSAWDELKQTQAAGHSRFEALSTATRNAGTYLAAHIDRSTGVGTATEGAPADLVLWNSNPLVADLSRSDLAGVILRGRWIPRAQIDQLRDQLRERLTREHATVNTVDRLLEKGDVKTARKAVSAASHSAPLLDEWVLLTKARKQGDHLPVAIDLARFYVEQFPSSFSAHQLLADLLRTSGNMGAARSEAQLALNLQPHSSTAANILLRATFSNTTPRYAAGNYLLRMASTTGLLHLEKGGSTWTGSLKLDGDPVPLRDISAGADQLWFKAGQDFQEKEIRLSISPTGEVTGSWWSMFGRNGAVTGNKIRL
jgi:imidazolonepropionase-like amidohydrolase